MDRQVVGAATAASDGTYETMLGIRDETPLGSYTVIATCGSLEETAPLDLARSQGASATPVAELTATAAVLMFFLLTGLQVVRLVDGSSSAPPSG
jgi:hypothetical protein